MLRSERLVEIREVNSSTSSQANVCQEKLSLDTRDRKKAIPGLLSPRPLGRTKDGSSLCSLCTAI